MEDVIKLHNQVINNYRLDEYLGYTGTAHVYRASHIETNKFAAVHLLPNVNVNKPNFIEAYIMKASQLKKLKHPNIVHTLSFGVELGYPFLVMNHIEGPTLRDLMNAVKRRMRRVPIDASVFIINCIAGAIAYAHDENITHNNLKPTNILLERSGTVMVTDFGLPQLVSLDPQTLSDTLEALIFEDRDAEIEMQRDLFALGLIFYEIITGQPAYESPNTEMLEDVFRQMKLVPPSKLVPEIPDNLEKVIVKIINPKTAYRYQSVNDMLADLAEISRKVKTTMLPTARLSDVAEFSSRFSSAIVPEEVETEKAKSVAVYFLDTGQVLELDNFREYTLGRLYEGQPMVPDIDLSPFKGYEWGISRFHASIRTNPDSIYITDLGSSNGTWHAGKRLEANQPYKLEHGDIIMLGKLRLQVLLPFKSG